ncbi:uncharacterized protein LOC141984486 [Natator depressus]|uniref:uncharacterized protein LOC141984486 n=1 Tax=Natator depressus TaxID=27790 RepID=UPI003EBC8F61
MQSSSAEVTMMESQNRKRAPAWTEREVRDLIAVWGEESVLSELRSSFRNAKTFVKISQGMKDRGHNRDLKQCRVKLKELRQAYQKTREANGRSGSEPQTCRFYDELHAILGGSATTTPAVLFDSFNGDGGNTEAGFGDEEDDDDDEVVDSSQQASGETGFPDSQELFLTLDLEPVPPEPTQGCLLDPAGGEGTSAACVSMITGSSPSQRLVKIRKKKKRTRDEMFSELMLSSHTDRAQTNAWRQIMSDCRKAQNDQEERWWAEESKWRAEESKWRAEERAEARMWRQRDERRQDSMLRLLEDQSSMLQCMVELQQRQLEHRLPLQPLCNQPPSSPSSIASTPRRPRTWVFFPHFLSLTAKWLLAADPAELRTAAVSCDSTLYSPEVCDVLAMEELHQGLRHLTGEEQRCLDTSLSVQELYVAAQQLSSGKAPGIDGLPSELDKYFWHLISSDFLLVAQECTLEKELTLSCHRAMIILLHNKGAGKFTEECIFSRPSPIIQSICPNVVVLIHNPGVLVEFSLLVDAQRATAAKNPHVSDLQLARRFCLHSIGTRSSNSKQ